MTKRLYIIAGPNGSGKTTLAKELVKEDNIVFLNVDEIAKRKKDSVGIKSGRLLLEEMDAMFACGESMVLESTVSGHFHNRVIERARKAKYEIVLVYIFLDSVEQNLERIKQRVALGGHNVPEEDVRRRYVRSRANFVDISKRVSYWELYYNGENKFYPVARGQNEIVEIVEERVYDKFVKGLKHDKA